MRSLSHGSLKEADSLGSLQPHSCAAENCSDAKARIDLMTKRTPQRAYEGPSAAAVSISCRRKGVVAALDVVVTVVGWKETRQVKRD
jgi:hypothetical protein